MSKNTQVRRRCSHEVKVVLWTSWAFLFRDCLCVSAAEMTLANQLRAVRKILWADGRRLGPLLKHIGQGQKKKRDIISSWTLCNVILTCSKQVILPWTTSHPYMWRLFWVLNISHIVSKLHCISVLFRGDLCYCFTMRKSHSPHSPPCFLEQRLSV